MQIVLLSRLIYHTGLGIIGYYGNCADSILCFLWSHSAERDVRRRSCSDQPSHFFVGRDPAAAGTLHPQNMCNVLNPRFGPELPKETPD